MSAGILSGVRVIDLSSRIAGPVASLQLLEAGASVVRVETPRDEPDPEKAGFSVWNRGKKRIKLDLTSDADNTVFRKLLAGADILIHDLSPCAARELGLSEPELATGFPELIVSSITAWPVNHPNCELENDDALVMARLGLLDEQPGHRPGPVFIRMPFASWLAAWLCAVGAIARLIQRERGDRAQPASTSLVQGALIPMTMHWAIAQRPSPSFARGLDKNVAIAIHQCSDGRWIHVHYSPDSAPWMRAALDEMGDERVATANACAGKNHTAPNFGANREIIATRPAQDWLTHFWEHDIAAQIVARFGEIYSDEQARTNGYVAELNDAEFGPTIQPGSCLHTSPATGPVGPLQPLSREVSEILTEWPAKVIRAGTLNDTCPPLSGLKVLDCGSHLAGPMGPMILADLGAEVVKIEPLHGDAMRYIERAFCGAQRGKRGVALQLKDPRARKILNTLIRSADVVHHNIRMPAARKLGLDPDSIKAAKPDIVSCHVSSYGPQGARADWPGFDQMFQSSCGWESANAGEGNPPMWLRFGVTDHLAALASAFATLLGVYHRDRTGSGQHVSTSLLGATILTVGETVATRHNITTPVPALDHEQLGLSRYHRLYQCVDGWVAIAARQSEETAALDSLTSNNHAAWFANRPAADALANLERSGIPCAPVMFDQQYAFLNDEHNRKAQLVCEYEHAEMGMLTQIGSFWRLGSTQPILERAPPTIGQHTREVLNESGFDDEEIDALAREGVIAI